MASLSWSFTIVSMEDDSPPLISVLMPIYNDCSFLREALASLLDQTMQDFEVVVVNDGSGEKESLRIREEVAVDKRL